MNESRKQFDTWWLEQEQRLTFQGVSKIQQSRRRILYMDIWISAWQASRQAQSIIAYLTHQGSAVSPDDFEGGEAEMHETANREEWAPLVKKGE